MVSFFLDCSQSSCFECPFSPGDFSDVYQRRQTSRAATEKERDVEEQPMEATATDESLFSCPNDGCVKTYQRYSALEKHLSFGKCELVLERESLLDKAKRLYRSKLLEGASAQATIEAGPVNMQDSTYSLSEGWALKSPKKSTRFNDAHKCYLEDKFVLGQETGHKLDPARVACDMRFAKEKEGRRQFTVREFLTAQQVQSFFSRRASGLRQVTTEDTEAAEQSEAYDNAHMLVLKEVQLCHPIVFDSFNLCDMSRKNRLAELSIAMLRTVCEHFDINAKEITVRCFAPYLTLLKELIESCECFRVKE